jgi:hypothetical protein
MVGTLHPSIHINIRKADEKWVRSAIAGHCGDGCFI